MRRFGSEVTIVERNNRLAHREDGDISEALRQLCQDEGIAVVTSASRHASGRQVGRASKAHGVRDGAELILEGTHLLVASAAGRPTQITSAWNWPASKRLRAAT